MDLLNILKAASATIEYKKFDDLPKGKYMITAASHSKTAYGERIKLVLGSCYVFLPDRYTKCLNEDSIRELKCSSFLVEKMKKPNGKFNEAFHFRSLL